MSGTLCVGEIVRGRKAWRGAKPTVDDVRKLWLKYPQTTMLTVSRRGSALLNDLTIQAKFPRREPLAVVNGDIESNPENYTAEGKLKKLTELKPSKLPVYKGMHVYMTKNVRKDVDFVNGMRGVVEAYHSQTKTLRVRTQTGYRVCVHPWTDADLGKKTYMPIRAGHPT